MGSSNSAAEDSDDGIHRFFPPETPKLRRRKWFAGCWMLDIQRDGQRGGVSSEPLPVTSVQKLIGESDVVLGFQFCTSKILCIHSNCAISKLLQKPHYAGKPREMAGTLCAGRYRTKSR